jgi:hypothetical protein
MTNEQINIAIAQACGWTEIDGLSAMGFMGKPPHKLCSFDYLPDYCNDLNAMFEAEKSLTREQIEVFCEQLNPKTHGVWWGIHATAHQRAEAFLKTIGKWKEEE